MKIRTIDWVVAWLHFLNAGLMFFAAIRGSAWVWAVLGVVFIVVGVWNIKRLMEQRELIREVNKEMEKIQCLQKGELK